MQNYVDEPFALYTVVRPRDVHHALGSSLRENGTKVSLSLVPGVVQSRVFLVYLLHRKSMSI